MVDVKIHSIASQHHIVVATKVEVDCRIIIGHHVAGVIGKKSVIVLGVFLDTKLAEEIIFDWPGGGSLSTNLDAGLVSHWIDWIANVDVEIQVIEHGRLSDRVTALLDTVRQQLTAHVHQSDILVPSHSSAIEIKGSRGTGWLTE
jgi:hypothetical protein